MKALRISLLLIATEVALRLGGRIHLLSRAEGGLRFEYRQTRLPRSGFTSTRP